MHWITLMDGDDLIKIRKAGDTGYWWVLQTTDLVSACGEEEAAEISGSKRMPILGELSLVPGKAMVSAEQQSGVLKSCGWEDAPDTEEAWVEMAQTYDLRVIVNSAYGATNESALKKVLKEACVALDGPVNHHLDRTINRLGQTGHEHLAGDMDSALKRAASRSDSTDEQRLMANLSSAQVRTVPQRKMSAECMLIQVWGPKSCDTCEVRGTPQCGGQNIRKTGKNENGHKVPIA